MPSKLPSGFPVNSREKAWTETRTCWLAERFGVDRLLNAEVILPIDEHFPDQFAGAEEDARQILDRLCELLNLRKDTIELQILADGQMIDAAGHEQARDHTILRVARSQLGDAERLIAVLSHELCRELLFGGGLLTDDVSDREWIIDLLTVFLGLGIFGANSAVREQTGRGGYLPVRTFGYALALFAFARHEDSPPWADHLRPDAVTALRDGLRYLHKTGDTIFHPDHLYKPRGTSAAELIYRIRTGSPSGQIIAFWDGAERQQSSAELLDAVSECLSSEDPFVPGEAARLLGAMGESAKPAVPYLISALQNKRRNTRAGAAQALGAMQAAPDEAIPGISELLREENREMIVVAAHALAQFGERAQSAVPSLLEKFHSALIWCDYPLMDELAVVLQVVSHDAKQAVTEYFDATDADLCAMALDALETSSEEDPIAG